MKKLFAVALVALPAVVHADEADMIVTASRTSAGDVTVVDHAAIQRLQPATVLEVLDRVPGVRAFSKGGIGGGSYLSLRGGEPNFTLVLLDGVRVNDPTNSQGGAFDFTQLSPHAIARIEVAPGGLSAVQGADALAGVVQLRLRSPDVGERSLAVGTSVDSDGGVSGDATLGYGWAGGGLLASGGWYDSGDLTPGSDLARGQGLLRFVHAAGDVGISGFALHARTDRETFPEDSGGPRLAVNRAREMRDTRLTVVALDVGRTDGTVRPHAALNWSRQDADVETPAIAPGLFDGVPAIASDTRFERFDAVADVRAGLGPWLTVAAGGEYLDERGRSRGTVDFGLPIPADFRIDRSVASGFAEATLAPSERVSATAGIRYDDASSGENEWSGRARLEATPLKSGPALFVGLSEGFKLPSLYALAYPLIANPDLKPERSRIIEIGAAHRFGNALSIRLTAFRNRFRDLIDFDPESFTNVNRARVTTKGVEFDANMRLVPSVRVTGNLTYLEVASETPLRSRPKWQGSVAATWEVRPNLVVDAGAKFNDSYYDSSVPTGLIRADGHVEVDLGTRWQLSEALSLSLVARNLLSEDYEDAVGFPAPGRTVRLAASMRL